MNKLIGLILIFSLSGCCTGGVPTTYLQADEATLIAIGDEYSAYVNNDPALKTKEDKQIKLDTIKRWKQRIDFFKQGGAK